MESNKKWFQKGAFEDGWQFGDLIKTIIGTTADVSENINAAVLDATENLIDTGAYGVGVIGGLFDKDFQDDVGKFIAKETLKPDKYGKTISDYTNPIGWTNALFNGGDTEKNSVLGDKSDGLVQSAAHVVGSQALGAINPGLTKASMAVNAFGNEIEQAYQRDATHLEAGTSGAITAGVELLTEKISSGIKLFKGAKSLDDGIVTALSRKISNKISRTLAKWGITTVLEAAEEPIAEYGSAIGRKLTYLKDEDINEIFTKEDAWDAFIGGLIISGGFGGGDVVNSTYKGVDPTTKLTVNDENIVKKLYDNEITQLETNGISLNFSEKNKVYYDIKTKFERGKIPADVMSKALGSEKYKEYKSIVKNSIMQENALKAGIGLIESIPPSQRTVEQNKMLAGAREQLKNFKNNSQTETLRKDEKEVLNKKSEGNNVYIDQDKVISAMWEDSLNNVEKSQLDVFDNNNEKWYNENNVIIDGSHLIDGKPKPNVKYKSGEYNYIYETDEFGNISRVYVEELKHTERKYRKRHKQNTFDKQVGDHAGHLIADRFGGSAELDNLVSQSALVNLSEYKKLENIWDRAIKKGKKVSFDIQVKYDGNSRRPSEFIVEYKVDSIIYKRNINN